MAQLLEAGKVESAKIRVENIIRSDINTELLEILELYCELLLARTGLMEGPTCDAGLEEPIKSLIYAAPRTEVKELQQVRALLMEKYGKEFALQAIENTDGMISEKVVKKLAVKPPPQELVIGYLEEIARTYGVDWPKKPKEDLGEPPDYIDDDDDENPSGGQAQKNLEAPLPAEGVAKEAEEREALSKATPPRNFGPSSPLRVNPPSPSTDNPHPRVKGTLDFKPARKITDTASKPGVKSKGPVGGTIPDVDELAQRFAALKK